MPFRRFRRFRNSRAEAEAFRRLLDATQATASVSGVTRTEPVRAGVRRLRLERLLQDGVSTRYVEVSFVPKESSGSTYSFDEFSLRWGVFSRGKAPDSFDARGWGDVDYMARFAEVWIGKLCSWEQVPEFEHPEVPPRNH